MPHIVAADISVADRGRGRLVKEHESMPLAGGRMTTRLSFWVGYFLMAVTLPTAAAAQDSPCVSQPEYTLDEDVPLVAQDSSRAEAVQGGGLILTEVVDAGRGMTLTIEGRSCLSYVVEYRLVLGAAPENPTAALSLLAGVLEDLDSHNRAPVPLSQIADVLVQRGDELLQGEPLAISGNEFGETVWVTYDPDASMISLTYVVGL
jgi:hypothetical protein